jgi:Flp pilus assembly protein TadG
MKPIRRNKGKGKRRERGQSLVEVALVLPVLLIILAGVLDLGRMYFSYVAITDAAGEGATYAAMHPDDSAGIYQRAQEATGGLVQIDPANVNVAVSGNQVVVTIEYDFRLATPVLGAIVPDGVLTLTAVATEVVLNTEL